MSVLTQLRSQRGSLLIDATAATVVIAVTLSASVGIIVGTAQASNGAKADTLRTIAVQTAAAEALGDTETYGPAPVVETVDVDGKPLPITFWVRDGMLNAALPAAGSTPEDCIPERLVHCLTAARAIPAATGPSLTRIDVVAAPDGLSASATIPAEVAEVRYQLDTADPGPDAELTITAGGESATVPLATAGSHYGTLQVDSGDVLDFTAGDTETDLNKLVLYVGAP